MPTAREPALSLQEAADALGVHYQTAYDWVRSGALAARKTGRSYQVSLASVHALRASRAAGLPPRREIRVRDWAAQSERLYHAIIEGQEALARRDLDRLVQGVPVVDLCELVIAPALRRVGEGWAAGMVSIAVEHRASAICERLIGGKAAQQPKGRPRGVAVAATAPGDRHALPSLMAAACLREDRWLVHHLAADLPAGEISQLALQTGAHLVVLSSATAEATVAAASAVPQLTEAMPGLAVLAGRPGASLYELLGLARAAGSGRGASVRRARSAVMATSVPSDPPVEPDGGRGPREVTASLQVDGQDPGTEELDQALVRVAHRDAAAVEQVQTG